MRLMKKIVIITYAAISVITGACALIFNKQLNITVDSLVPAFVLIFNTVLGFLILNGNYFLDGGRWCFRLKSDYKYSKGEYGKGSFKGLEYRRYDWRTTKAEKILAYVFLFIAAATVPCIFFFPIPVKWICLAVVIIEIFPVSFVTSLCITGTRIKKDVDESRARTEQYEKELEEQKKKEEQGRWR